MDNLTLTKGITEDQIDRLIYHTTHDCDIHRFTRDKTRFADREEIYKWKKRTSAIVTLTDDSKELLGLIWIEKLLIPSSQFIFELDESLYQHTFAVRLYAHARGKRLANWFIEQAFALYPTIHVWLKTSHDNQPAVRTYLKAGFHVATDPDDDGKIIMILPS